jgi:xanthine dehydrogenase YagR molybdenum-binding subunit
MGSRGIGEIGIVGTAAAIANPAYNGTGRRERKLPLTPDKIHLLTPPPPDGRPG